MEQSGLYAGAERLEHVALSAIRVVLDKVRAMQDAGRTVIPLLAGEPDFDTPEDVKQATIAALNANMTHYGSNRGLIQLRERIAARLQVEAAVPYDPETEVLVTSGGAEAINNALFALVNPGEEVLYFTPAFANYENVVRLCGGVPVPVPLSLANGFQPDAAAVRENITKKTKLLILNNPNNPTGAAYSREALEGLAALCKEYDLLAFSDEIYSTLVYGDANFISFAALPGMRERTVTMNGFSKAYAMTGWRLGYLAADARLMRHILKVHQYSTTCSPTFLQAGLSAAVDSDGTRQAVERMLAAFARRRDLIVNGLSAIPGLNFHAPQGAFYAFVDVSVTGLSGGEFAERLLIEQGVAIVPGAGFGAGYEGFIRLSFAASEETILEGLRRLKLFTARLLERGGN